MHITANEIPIKIDAPGAVARQARDFGTASGTIGAEHFTMSAGTDLAPLLAGLNGDVCHSAHWGYMIDGEVVVTYHDGTDERCSAGEVFHWPSGHSVRVERDAEIVIFSPQDDHTPVLDHILGKMADA